MGIRRNGRAMSLGGGMAFGAAGALLWTLAGSLAVGKLLDSGLLAWENVGIGSAGILLSASWLGAWLAWHRVRRLRLTVMLGTAGLYYLGLVTVALLVFRGDLTGMGITAMVVLGGAGGAILAGMCEKRGGKGARKGKRMGKIVQPDYR